MIPRGMHERIQNVTFDLSCSTMVVVAPIIHSRNASADWRRSFCSPRVESLVVCGGTCLYSIVTVSDCSVDSLRPARKGDSDVGRFSQAGTRTILQPCASNLPPASKSAGSSVMLLLQMSSCSRNASSASSTGSVVS